MIYGPPLKMRQEEKRKKRAEKKGMRKRERRDN
jgi:hypothetical protein